MFQSGRNYTSIEGIDIDKPPNGKSWSRVIDSPRSLEAFKRTGIFVKELDPVSVKKLEAQLKIRFGTS